MNRQLLRFLSVITVVLAYSMFKAYQLWPEAPYLALSSTLVLFSIMLGSQFIYRAGPTIIKHKWFQILAWSGALIMGLWGSFILLSLLMDLLRLVLYPLGIANDYFTQEFYLVIFAVAVLITIIGFFEVLRGPRVKTVQINIPNLPKEISGLKIAQISDLHIGPTIGTSYVEQVVSLTNATKPDMVFITGDLADAKAVSISEQLAALGKLQSRFGVFYVTGNHEYYWDAIGLIAATKRLGFTVLLNENCIVEIANRKILIAGVTDPAGVLISDQHAPNMQKAINNNNDTYVKILLAHRPEACYEAEPLGFDLQFSGHTHAGQFFPFNILVSLVHKYYKGLNKHGNLWLYVNPGTGYWGAANRFAIAAEISLVTLQ